MLERFQQAGLHHGRNAPVLRRLLTLFHSAALQRPGTVIGLSAVVTLFAVMLAGQVEFRTSRSELANKNGSCVR